MAVPSDATSAAVVEDLWLARALLVVHGRAVGDFEDDRKRLCLVAAADHATGEDELRYAHLTKVLSTQLPSRVTKSLTFRERIILFNDDTETTDQDVLDVVDKALAELGALG